jgi:hypothetical protein
MHSDRRRNERMRKASEFVTWIGMLAGMAPALSAPVVQQVSGTADHNGTITISGSGFGSKSSAAPIVWDNANGANMSAKWDGAEPSQVPGYNTQYYAPMRGIDPPHSHDTRYIAGAHASNAGANSGLMVEFFKNIPLQPFPFYIYASWYQRADNNWVFGGDNNFKTFAYSNCCDPYQGLNYWYTNYGPPHPDSATDSAQWTIGGAGALKLPDTNGHNAWWGAAVNPMAGKWSKVEIALKVTDQANGSVTVWENGHQVMNYVGPTDTFPGTRRTVGIGGYARMEGYTSNWRYFDDVYLDTTLARVVLADTPVLSQATIIENQIPSAWSDGSITATVNLGKFAQGQTAYLFVVDASGTPSASGVAVTAGGAVAVPNPPPAVSVK